MALNSFWYSIPYILLITLCFWMSFREERARPAAKKRYVDVVVIVLVFFFGLRGFVHTDFQNYYPWFEDLPTIWSPGIEWKVFMRDWAKYEPGFVIYSILCKSVLPSYFMWILVSAAIDIVLLRKVFERYSSNVCMSFAIYLAIGGLIMEFSLMRNIKAILIILLALRYIREKDFKMYVLYIVAATLFHSTALLFLPLYFVLDKRIPKGVLLTVFIIGMATILLRLKYMSTLLVNASSVFGQQYSALAAFYLGQDKFATEYGISFGLVERVLTFGFVYFNYGKIRDKSGDKYIFPNMFVLYFMSFTLLYEVSVVLERIAYYFALSYCIFYPQLRERYRGASGKRLVVTAYILLVFMAKIAIQTKPVIYRYDNLLFGIESYYDRLSKLDRFNTR
ncbi:MAG: EpsG family protein [Bacteroidales bacterium]|nr:EpsG family protein [Bacteroidales bacterium]